MKEIDVTKENHLKLNFKDKYFDLVIDGSKLRIRKAGSVDDRLEIYPGASNAITIM